VFHKFWHVWLYDVDGKNGVWREEMGRLLAGFQQLPKDRVSVFLEEIPQIVQHRYYI